MATESPIGVGSFLGALDVTLDLPLASVGSRGLANLVDMLLWILTSLFLAAFATLATGFLPSSAAGMLWLIVFVSFFLLYWGFFSFFEIVMDGQTPGKRLLGLRVVSEDGSSAPPLSILLRNLGRIIDFFPGFYGIGVPVMILQAQSKRVGDLLAGTVVVREHDLRCTHTERKWPPRFDASDAALLEAYFSRVKAMSEEYKRALSANLLLWLTTRHPEFVGSYSASEPAEAVLARLFDPHAMAFERAGEDQEQNP